MSESLTFCIDTLKHKLLNYKDYLSVDEKKALFNKIQVHKDLHSEIEWVVVNKEPPSLSLKVLYLHY